MHHRYFYLLLSFIRIAYSLKFVHIMLPPYLTGAAFYVFASADCPNFFLLTYALVPRC